VVVLARDLFARDDVTLTSRRPDDVADDDVSDDDVDIAVGGRLALATLSSVTSSWFSDGFEWLLQWPQRLHWRPVDDVDGERDAELDTDWTLGVLTQISCSYSHTCICYWTDLESTPFSLFSLLS